MDSSRQITQGRGFHAEVKGKFLTSIVIRALRKTGLNPWADSLLNLLSDILKRLHGLREHRRGDRHARLDLVLSRDLGSHLHYHSHYHLQCHRFLNRRLSLYWGCCARHPALDELISSLFRGS